MTPFFTTPVVWRQKENLGLILKITDSISETENHPQQLTPIHAIWKLEGADSRGKEMLSS